MKRGFKVEFVKLEHAKANNECMKNCDKNNESSYIEYLDANNLYGWAVSQKSPVKRFKWVKKKNLSKFNEDFIKKYDEDCNKGYFLEVDIDYPKKLFISHKDLPFLPERKNVEKIEKLICGIEDKEKYVINIRALKQALNRRLVLGKVHKIIQFKQKAWLKLYIDMNTDLKKMQKTNFKRISLS